MKVFIIDDSVVFRKQISEVLSSYTNVEVVGSAANGSIAIKKLKTLQADLAIIDLEMPVMDGIQTIRELKNQGIQLKIIVFSSTSLTSVNNTLTALEVGADEFAVKPGGNTFSMEDAAKQIKDELLPKVQQFMKKKERLESTQSSNKTGNLATNSIPRDVNSSCWKKIDLLKMKPKIIVIACSTGGPNALDIILKDFPSPIPAPIVIVQHMPELFTKQLAVRLSSISGHHIREAIDNETIKNGQIYIAPGNYHLNLTKKENGEVKIEINQKDKRNFVRPCADFTFESAAQAYKSETMGVVLTGMGRDGAAGSCAIKDVGGGILIQDEASSIVWGMAGSVYELKAFDLMANIERCRDVLHYICHKM